MVGEDRDELVLVLGLQQVFHRARRQLGEGLVRGCEDGEGPIALQGVDEPRGFDGRDECVELTRRYSGIHDVGGLCGDGAEGQGNHRDSGEQGTA